MKTITEQPLLVLSCRGLIEAVFWDRLKPNALRRALFFFDCPLQDIYTDLKIPDDLAEYPSALFTRQEVFQAIDTARKEGRAVFSVNPERGWEQLNELLVSNNEQPFPPSHGERYSLHAAVLTALYQPFSRYLWWQDVKVSELV